MPVVLGRNWPIPVVHTFNDWLRGAGAIYHVLFHIHIHHLVVVGVVSGGMVFKTKRQESLVPVSYTHLTLPTN